MNPSADAGREHAEAARRARSSTGELNVNVGSVRNGWLPNAARPIASAVTELSTTSPKERVSKLRRISSSAKNTPAIGALNVAEIPPAAPHATSRRSWDSEHPQQLPGHRPQRGADLHDRALAPDRTARADTQRRGERLHDRHLRAHPAAEPVDREHHLRHAVPARLRREAAHQRPVDQPAHDRREPPRTRSPRPGAAGCPHARRRCSRGAR